MRIYLREVISGSYELVLEEKGQEINVIRNIKTWSDFGKSVGYLVANNHMSFKESVLFLEKCEQSNIHLLEEIDISGFPDDEVIIRLETSKYYKALILEGKKSGKIVYWNLSPLHTWTHIEFAISHFVFGGYIGLREAHSFIEIEKNNDLDFPQFLEDMSEDAKKDRKYCIMLDDLDVSGHAN
ncbi:MAG: hypothetical protein L3J07_03355 [Candidatus Magasanikbacteria bacterium]|nr:hypothetical protein [Candidatus Magasanikbacteria bacterium]